MKYFCIDSKVTAIPLRASGILNIFTIILINHISISFFFEFISPCQKPKWDINKLKAFIKPFKAPQSRVKIKIHVNYFKTTFWNAWGGLANVSLHLISNDFVNIFGKLTKLFEYSGYFCTYFWVPFFQPYLCSASACTWQTFCFV